MNKLNFIVFSKDRACQLELFLRSLKVFWKGVEDQEIKVIYTYSNDDFKRGYEKLIANNDLKVEFIQQSNFRQDIIKSIDTQNELTMFAVDDDVFIREFDLQCEEISFFKLRPEIITLSLRLGKLIDYCYTANKYISRPQLIEGAKYDIWNWTEDNQGDWTYPFSLDCHIFDTSFIYDMVTKHDFKSPNTLEGFFARIVPYAKYLMMSFKEPKIINIANNKVQKDNGNRHGNITAEYLNQKYLRGLKIKYDSLDLMNKKSCHVESDMKFFRMKG